MVDVAQMVEPRIVIPVVVGSIPIGHPSVIEYVSVLSLVKSHQKNIGPLAQLVEQLTLNQRVVGSIPTRPSKKSC